MIIVNPSEITEPFFEFVSMKDPHMNFGFANRVRFDHQNDLTNKLNFTRQWCKERNIQNLVMTGDVTDTNEEKKWSFNQYVLNKLELLKFKEDGITIWSPAGNHDMFNGMVQTDNTVFGEFVREGVLKHLTRTPLIKTFRDPENRDRNIFVIGIDYSKHKEVVQQELKRLNDYQSFGILKIVVFHSHCTPAEIAVTDFTYEELVKTYTNIDMFICGHYHGGFPSYTFFRKYPDGSDTSQHVKIVNNWSFQRVIRDYYNEMNVHTPEFEHIKIAWSHSTNDFIMSTETIKIPCKKYEDAFKPKMVELIKLTKKEHFEFFDKINFEEIPTGSDDIETINNLARKEEFSPEVVALAIHYLNNVEVEDIEYDN